MKNMANIKRKEKNSCGNFYPTSVCNDDKCDIKPCNSRHPMPCRFYNLGICKYHISENTMKGWLIKILTNVSTHHWQERK